MRQILRGLQGRFVIAREASGEAGKGLQPEWEFCPDRVVYTYYTLHLHFCTFRTQP